MVGFPPSNRGSSTADTFLPLATWQHNQDNQDMARLLALAAIVVVLVTCTSGQISFGTGGKELRKVVKEEKVVRVNFASDERRKKKPIAEGVSLAELLKDEQNLPPKVSSRFAFGGSASLGKVGQGCSTPSGQQGSCNYITAGQ